MSAIHLSIHPRRMRTHVPPKTHTRTSIVALVHIAKNGDNPKICQQSNEWNSLHQERADCDVLTLNLTDTMLNEGGQGQMSTTICHHPYEIQNSKQIQVTGVTVLLTWRGTEWEGNKGAFGEWDVLHLFLGTSHP
jgi:hypothetical protein